MNEQNKKVPTLRFKGFTNDWEQRKFLNEIDNIIDYRGRTPKKLGMSWSQTGYLALSALNVKNGWIDKKSKDSHFGNQVLYDAWMKNTPLYKGQVVFTTEAPMGNVAQIPDNEKYILSQRTIAFKPSQKLTDGFLADLLSTNKVQNKLKSLATGGTAKGVSQKSLKLLKIIFPSMEEQKTIHEVIKRVHILITLQQRKLDLLKQLKKGLLQKMFADKDSKRPILRFEGFNNEWECKKLGDIARMYQPETITSSKLASTGYPVFGANGYIGFYSEANHMDDQVTISARGEGTGTPSYVKGPVWITGNSMVINVDNSGIDKAFLFNNLSAHSLKKYVTGGAQPQLTREVLKGISIMLSGQNEQTKIGDLSKRLIKIISVQQNKLSKLKDVKKALLQQMFI